VRLHVRSGRHERCTDQNEAIKQITIDPALLLLKVLACFQALLAFQDADTIRILDLLVADVVYGGRQVSKLVWGAGK